MKLIVKLFLILLIISSSLLLFAADVVFRLNGDSNNNTLDINNSSDVTVSSITASGRFYFKNLYNKYNINSSSITLSDKLVINNRDLTVNKINAWNNNYVVIDDTNTNWNYAAYILKISSSNWDKAYDIFETSTTKWNQAQNAIISSSPRWDLTFDIVKTTNPYWYDLYSIIESSHTVWYESSTDIINTRDNWDYAYSQIVDPSIFLRNDMHDQTSGKLTAEQGFETDYGIEAATGVFSGNVTAFAFDTGYGAFKIGQDMLTTSNVQFNQVQTNKLSLLPDDGLQGILINNSNYVALGTITPLALLHVGHADNNGTASNGEIILGKSDGLSQNAQYKIGLDNNNSLSIGDYSNEQYSAGITITDNGNVGIGTTEPKEKLEVYDGSTYYYGLPIGSIIPFAGTEPPPGWMVCDGSGLDRDDYYKLWDVIEDSWGSSYPDFYLPDLRGRFLRGKDSSSGRDEESASRVNYQGFEVGDVVGSLQDEAYKLHNHGMGSLMVNYSGEHTHDVILPKTTYDSGDGWFGLDNGDGLPGLTIRIETDDGGTGLSPLHNHTVTGVVDPEGDAEVRPDSAVVIFIIKAWD